MSAQDINAPDSWHDRKVFDYQTGHYLGRAVGEPFSDGVEGLIALRQDESGQTIKSHALCAFVVLDDPATTLGREAALAALAARRADQPEQIDDATLPAGSPMHFYCIACGHLAASLPETYTERPPRLCGECKALEELGWLT